MKVFSRRQGEAERGGGPDAGITDEGSLIVRRVGVNSTFLGSALAMSSAFMIIAVAISARALSAREFGIFVLLRSTALLLQAVTSFATHQPVIKLGSDAMARGDKRALGQVVSLALIIDLVAGVIALGAAAVIILGSQTLLQFDVEHVPSAWILAASLLLASFPASNGVYRLYNRFALLAAIQTIPAATMVAVYAVLYVEGAGLDAFVGAWALYLAVAGQLQLWIAVYLVRKDGVTLRPQASFLGSASGRLLIRYCWTTWVSSSADAVRSNADSLLVGAIVSVEAAGLYGLARQISGVLRKFTTIYGSTVFPEVARFASSNDDAGASMFKKYMLRTTIVMGVASMVLVTVLGTWLLSALFGERFTAAYFCLVVLTAAAAAQMVSYTPSMYVQVYKGPSRIMWLNLLATAVFVVVAVPLTLGFSMVGMALAQLLCGLTLVGLSLLDLRTVRAWSANLLAVSTGSLPSKY